MISFKYLDYLKYKLGDRQLNCHVDAIHAKPPKSDLYTEEIVLEVMEKTGCSGIVALVSRIEADLNRSPDSKNKKAIDEYRFILKKNLEDLDILDEKGFATEPYLHLSIHGMADRPDFEVEIGTFKGASCSKDFRHWFIDNFKKHIKKYIPNITIQYDYLLYGYPSLTYYRLGDSENNYSGHGELYNTVQLEFSTSLRENNKQEIINLLRDIILGFKQYNNAKPDAGQNEIFASIKE